MRLAEQHNLISNEQYGGRNKHQAPSVILNKIMYYNISTQTRILAAFMDDDTRAYYDRILTSLNGLENRRWGMAYKVTKFTTNFIESQVYSIRTGAGISKFNYKFECENPIQGNGQGISWAGPRWINSGDTCSRILKKNCAGMKFQDPSRTLLIQRTGDFFVDDRANGTTANAISSTSTEIDILSQFQKDEQIYAHALFSLGHKLALDKYKYYIAKYKRNPIRYKHMSIAEAPGELKIRDSFDGEPFVIQRVEPHEPHTSLGCVITISGNQTPQYDELHAKVLDWKNRVVSSTLSGDERLTAYNSYLKKSLKYVLPTTSLPKPLCKNLDIILSPVLLNAFSTNRNCSRLVLYSPEQYGGFGILDFWHLQGTEKIKFFFMHYRRHDTTCMLFKISLLWLQMEAGLSQPFYKYKYSDIDVLLTDSWLKHLYQYLDSYQVTLHEYSPWTYNPPCEHDFFIQEYLTTTDLSKNKLLIINEIRLALRIYTASDTVPLGRTNCILPNIIECHNLRESRLEWPRADSIHHTWKKIWKDIMVTYIQPKLQSNPIGKRINHTHQKWAAHISEDGNYIEYKGQTFKKATATRQPKFTMIYRSSPTLCHIPGDIICHHNGSINLVGTELMSITAPHEPDGNVYDYVARAPKWQRRIWGTANVNDDSISLLIIHMINDNVVAAGDGSVREGRASHGWSLVRKDDYSPIIEGAGPTYGNPNFLTSMRPETSACIAASTLLHLVASAEQLYKATVPFFTDSLSVVQHADILHWHKTRHIYDNDMDVILENNRLLKRLKNPICPYPC